MRVIAVALLCLGLLAGCPGRDASTDVDADRLAVLRAEPLLSTSVVEVLAEPAFQISDKAAPERGLVSAVLVDEASEEPVADARDLTGERIAALRSADWTVYYAACVPPREPGQPYQEGSPQPGPLDEAWRFVAYAYKVVDEVSYFAMLDGTGRNDERVTVGLLLRVPHSSEPQADVFADRPEALAPGVTCLEQTELPVGFTEHGTATMMGDNGPDPQGDPMPPGFR